MRTRLQRATVVALLLPLAPIPFLTACSPGGERNGPTPEPTSPGDEVALPILLAAQITPGKPGAPTESIELRSGPNGFLLTVRRAPPGGAEARGEARLDEASLDSLRRGPLTEALEFFSSAQVPTPEPDFGERILRLQRDAASAEEVWSWERSLQDEHHAQVIFGELARLARTRVPTVPLAYFPTDRT